MAVYVDDAKNEIRNGRGEKWVACHMIADSHEELIDMAETIWLNPNWIQSPGERNEHFDISQELRRRVVSNGAKTITQRELVERLHTRDLLVYMTPPARWKEAK